MVCLSCDAVVDPCWRWCPECGGQLAEPAASDRYREWEQRSSVEWMLESDRGFHRDVFVA